MKTSAMSWEQALAVLGVSADAGDEAIRAAYVELVRKHPPDRDPDQFECVRDAYALLRDPRSRARRVLDAPDVDAPLAGLLDGVVAERRFVTPQLWLDVLKESRSARR